MLPVCPAVPFIARPPRPPYLFALVFHGAAGRFLAPGFGAFSNPAQLLLARKAPPSVLLRCLAYVASRRSAWSLRSKFTVTIRSS
jgi:hypothetical protein